MTSNGIVSFESILCLISFVIVSIIAPDESIVFIVIVSIYIVDDDVFNKSPVICGYLSWSTENFIFSQFAKSLVKLTIFGVSKTGFNLELLLFFYFSYMHLYII